MPEREVTILAKLTDKMSSPLRGISSMFGKLGGAAVAAAGVARTALRGVTRAVGFLRRSIFNLRNLLLAGAFAGIIKVFADFERGIANVATLVDTTVVSMEDLSEAVLKVSQDTGEGLGSLNEALFDIISAGVEAEKAGGVLLEASRLAKGGATTTAAATKGIVSVMNAYGLAVEDAAALSDAFFTAQKGGITTVDALSRSVGKLAPTASLAGLSIDEMLAAIAAITKSGVSTTEAVTGLKSVITTLIKPTEGAREAARKLGIQFDSSRVKGGNFAAFLDELAEKTELDERVLAKLFPNVRAFATVANLAAKDGKNFNDILGTMADKAGATAEAVAKVEQTLSDKIKLALADLKVFFVRVGEAAKPFIEKVIQRIRDWLADIGARRAQIQAFISTVAKAIGQIGIIAATIFRKGDVIRFVINVISGAIEAGIRTTIAAIPVLIRTAQRIGREVAIALVDSLVGTSNEALARKLASGKRGAFRAGLRLFGFSEEELEDLAVKGRQLNSAVQNLEIQRARGAQAAPGTEAKKRFDRAIADVDRIRQNLAGEAFDDIRESDSRILNEQVKIFLGQSKKIAEDFFAGLPEGLSPETQAAMEKFGQIIGDDYKKAMEAAIAIDEETRRKAEEEGQKIGGAISEGIGTGFIEGEGTADDLTGMLQTLDIGIDGASQSFQRLGQKIQEVRALGEGGFITQSEAQERENQLIADANAEIALLQTQFDALKTSIGGSVPLTKLYGEELEVMASKLAQFRQEISDYTTTQGTFFTGLEAGIMNTVERLGDLRQAGLSAGQTLASAVGDGLIVALEKGGEAFKQFALGVLKQLAQMILKAVIYKAIMAGLGGGFNEGGSVGGGTGQAFASGGRVFGPNVNRDIIPARLTPGEFVQPRGVVDHYGVQVMEALRRRLIPRSALAQFGKTPRPIPTGSFLQGGGQPSNAINPAPAPAYVVADDDTMDRLLAGGEGAFFEFLRRRADTINGVLRSDG